MPADALPTSALSYEQIKAGMRAAWTAGDFGVVARTVERDAEDLAARLTFAPGTRVLDIATGSGNLALPIARRGAAVTGVDIAPNLLEQARVRARDAGLTVAFDEGDAEQLPYPDASFDSAVTMFGAMFAPRPERVAAELARVLRPGGTLAMANWTPGGFSGHVFAATARHAPPPLGPDGAPLPPPVLWGDPISVHHRLDGLFRNIRTERVRIVFDLPMSPEATVEHFRRFFGPTQAAFHRLNDEGKRALHHDLVALWREANTADDPALRTLVHNEYLLVTATRAE